MAAIYLLSGENELVEMREEPYDSEAVLQELLARHPELLSGDLGQSGEPQRWLLVKREMAVASDGGSSGTWAVDHLFVDQDGIPTLVEVKRSQNSEIRRSVVGQLLDYAANAVVYWPVEKLRATFESACERAGLDPLKLIEDLVCRDDPPDLFWQLVATNLQAQRIRLIFVADEIPPELKRVIEFLNGQMSPAEVLGIEVRQFSGRGLKTLVPKLIGKTAEAETRKGAVSSPRRDDWSWEAYEQELRVPPHRIAVGRALTESIRTQIASRGLSWRIVPRKGYMAILRPGDYKVAVVDVYWRKTPRLALKLPAHPQELGLTSPFLGLPEDWDPNEKEWGWTISSVDEIPDMQRAIELVEHLHPLAGPMRLPGGSAG